MKIIAWDKITDKAIQPERAPFDKEWCKIDEGGGKYVKKQWNEPAAITPDPVIPITNIAFSGTGLDPEQPSNGRVDLLAGLNVTITFNVSLPDGTKLTIPVRNRDTQKLKVIKAKVLGGAVTKTFKFAESGFYVINSDEVNAVGRDGVDFQLDPMLILVQDD